jgi:hypothetical protein
MDPELAAYTFICNLLGFALGQILRPEQPAPEVEPFVRNYVDIFLKGVETR